MQYSCLNLGLRLNRRACVSAWPAVERQRFRAWARLERLGNLSAASARQAGVLHLYYSLSL